MQEPPPVKQVKPLPKPDDAPRKKEVAEGVLYVSSYLLMIYIYKGRVYVVMDICIVYKWQ